MEVTDPDPGILHIVGEIFRHAFGERCDQDLVMKCGFSVDFTDQIVNLPFDRAYLHPGVQKACGTDDLFRPQKFVIGLVLARRGGYE